MLDALEAVLFGTATLTSADDLLAHEVTIFRDWVQVDVQTATSGIEFATAWRNRETLNYQGQEFYVVCKANLIASKQAAERPKDLEDVRLLKLQSNS